MKLKNKISLLFLLGIALIQPVYAKWMCMEVATIREGNTYKSCGVGEAPTESEARAKARSNAIKEFQELCDISANCKDREFNITPLRNSCSKINNSFKCFRGIQFEITNVKVIKTKTDPEKLKKLEEQLEKVQTQYEQQKKEHEVQQKIKNLEKKIKDKNFKKEKTRPSFSYHRSYFAFGLNLINKLPIKNVNKYYTQGVTGVGLYLSWEDNLKKRFYTEYTISYNNHSGVYEEGYKQYDTKFESLTLNIRPKYYFRNNINIGLDFIISHNYFGDSDTYSYYSTNVSFTSEAFSIGPSFQYFFKDVKRGSFYLSLSVLKHFFFKKSITIDTNQEIQDQINTLISIGYVYGN
jgi:hypothetical protein